MSGIILHTPTATASNDASIAKYTHPPPYIQGPYAQTVPSDSSRLSYLPSLAWFCLNKLFPFPDQVHAIGPVRLNYQPPASRGNYDILRALIPSLHLPDFDWADVDPRLWITLVQIYDNLPAVFQCYPILLADKNLRLIQSVPSTPRFSLITILELPGCRELLDSTIVNLKHLHSLCAFDASATDLSTYGVKVLSGTVLWSHDTTNQTRKGPWGLRILRLRNCRNVDCKVFPHLSQFRLLSVLDLRGTQCLPGTFLSSFSPASREKHELFHPTPLRLSLSLLLSSAQDLLSSSNVFTLYINTLHHPPIPVKPTSKKKRLGDACVTFHAGSSDFTEGSSKQQPKPGKRGGNIPQDKKGREADDCLCDPCVGVEGLFADYHERRRFSDTELQNNIAEQEITALASKQDVLSFYHSAKVAIALRNLRNSARGYTYPPELFSQPSTKDARLMLFRPPPPWGELEATTPYIQPTKHFSPGLLEVVTAFSKSKKAEMAEYSEQVNAKRRRIQERNMAHSERYVTEKAPEVPRNPFRRKVVAGPPEIDGISTTKPLRPSSSIAVPLLPTAGAKTTKKEVKTDCGLAQATLPTLFGRRMGRE
ncbi:hypothetical protein B0H10DRAFT_1938941 [Mycena sp. CBHHK59/15]|nr:hypothetical protein B0H10DRAFT_1938941 [Mycena sp. CBHHK59/15]